MPYSDVRWANVISMRGNTLGLYTGPDDAPLGPCENVTSSSSTAVYTTYRNVENSAGFLDV